MLDGSLPGLRGFHRRDAPRHMANEWKALRMSLLSNRVVFVAREVVIDLDEIEAASSRQPRCRPGFLRTKNDDLRIALAAQINFGSARLGPRYLRRPWTVQLEASHDLRADPSPPRDFIA